ncbi:hypothetical protein HAX54_023808, partial [Datura stramonium]|nr:hypothetical protein [Datura stramonium]
GSDDNFNDGGGPGSNDRIQWFVSNGVLLLIIVMLWVGDFNGGGHDCRLGELCGDSYDDRQKVMCRPRDGDGK